MISSGLNLVMTVIGFAVSTMFIVFICTRLVCARIQLNATRRSFPIATRSDLSILERGLNGLEPVVYANFPTKKYSDSFFTSTEDTQCTVCLAEYQSEDLLRILPYCGHFFHVTCIDIWLRQHSTCPVCRISLRELSDRKRGMQPLYSSAVRSQLSSESYETRSHHCLLNGHGFPSSTHVNPGMESNRGDHFVSEGDTAEVVDIVSPIAEDNQIMKDSRTKHVESPSNT